MALICSEQPIPTLNRNDKCPFIMNEMQRLFIQKIYKEGIEHNEIVLIDTSNTKVDADNIKTLDFWKGKFNLSTTEKVTSSPIINAPATEPGETTYFGGVGTTANGKKRKLTTANTVFNAEIHDAAPKTIETLQDLEDVGSIGVYFLNDKNYLYGKPVYEDVTIPLLNPDGTPQLDGDGNPMSEVENKITKIRPIPITAFTCKDKQLGGNTGGDINAMSFEMYHKWSAQMTEIDLVFDHYNEL